MHLADAIDGDGAAAQPAVVDPSLHGDMGPGLELQIALARIGAVVVPERPLDIDGVRVMPLDQIAVVAVHRAHELGQGREHAMREASLESGSPRRQLQRQIGQPGPARGAFPQHKGLHGARALAPVRGR